LNGASNVSPVGPPIANLLGLLFYVLFCFCLILSCNYYNLERDTFNDLLLIGSLGISFDCLLIFSAAEANELLSKDVGKLLAFKPFLLANILLLNI